MAFNVQAAKAAGYSDDEIANYMASKQVAAPTMGTPEQPKSSSFADLLPLIGGVAGSFIPGAGTILGGALGAGAGALLKQGIKKDPFDVGEIAKEAVFSGLGGVAGKALGFAGSKLLPGLARGATETGEKLAVKAFRPTPSQLTEFAAETGEPFQQYLAKKGFTGLEDVAKHVDTLQNGFDNVVLNKNLVVDTDNIISKFADQINRLNESINPADQGKAETLQKIALNFIRQYGDKPLTADALTALRKEIDKGIKDFALDQGVKGPLNLTRDVFQDSLREAADNAGITIGDQSLKEAGIELSKGYKALAIGERQANLGKGSLPTKLTSLIAGGIGGATGGIPGAAGGIAAAEAINNPGTISLLSKLATSTGKALSKVPPLSPNAATALERIGVGAGALPGGEQPAMEGQIIPNDPQAMLTAITGGAETPTGTGGNVGLGSEEEALKQVLASVMFSKAKSVSDLKTAFEFLNPTKKPLTGTQQLQKTNAESGLRSLKTVESILKSDPNAPLKSRIPIVAGRSPYATAAREISDVITRLRTGAALTDNEEKFYRSQLPEPFDSPQTIQYKLNLFKQLFSQVAYGQTPATPDVETNTLFSD